MGQCGVEVDEERIGGMMITGIGGFVKGSSLREREEGNDLATKNENLALDGLTKTASLPPSKETYDAQ